MHTSVRKTIVIVLTIAMIYALAGLLLAPYLLKRQIIDVLSDRTGGEVTLGQLSVNPFLFSADLGQLTINTPDRAPSFTLLSAQARFDIASLWSRGWTIRELVLDTPRLWMDALPEAADARGDVNAFKIKNLQIRRGQLQWTGTDTTVGDAIIDLTELEFTLENPQSSPLKPGRFSLAAVVNHSGGLRSDGSLRLFPIRLDATLELSGLNLADFDSLMTTGSDPGQQLEILSALLSGKFDAHFENGQASIHGQAEIDQFEMVGRTDHAAIFSAAKVQASELAIQGSPLRVSAGLLQLNQPHLRLALDADGNLHGGHWLRPLFDASASLKLSALQIDIHEGLLDLADQGLAPPYLLKTDRVEGSIIRHDSGTSTTIEGRVMGGSTSVLNAHWLPNEPGGHSRLDISVANLDATVLSPYLAALSGRGIASGQLDLRLDYQADGQQYELKNEITALGFQLDEAPASPVADELPLDLAVALVRDDNDRINVTIPLPPGRLDDDLRPASRVGEGFRNLVQSISNAPFRTLGELAGVSSPRLERVVFIPGDAALPEVAARKLTTLAAALVQRPGLGLQVNGCFDAVTDLKALARKQVALHVALASSAGPPGRGVPSAIDFNDSKVISVLDEFAGERLSAAELAALQAYHPQRGSAYHAAVFEALVVNEPVSRTALKSLARYRARSIVDQLGAAGVDPARLQIGSETETDRANARVVSVELVIALL